MIAKRRTPKAELLVDPVRFVLFSAERPIAPPCAYDENMAGARMKAMSRSARFLERLRDKEQKRAAP